MLVQVVVASMVGGYLAGIFHLMEERDEARPVYCSFCSVPVLDVPYWMNRDEFLGLEACKKNKGTE